MSESNFVDTVNLIFYVWKIFSGKNNDFRYGFQQKNSGCRNIDSEDTTASI